VMSVHVLVYAPRLPRLLFSRGRRAGARIGLVAGSLLAGAALAAATYSLASPWIHRAHEHEREGALRAGHDRAVAAYLNVLM
jgi:hypothetical protein